jgi:hypothetical protein
MAEVGNFVCRIGIRGRIVYRHDLDDDALSIQRWLWLGLGRDAGPFVYRFGATEGSFRRDPRGALTVRLVRTGQSGTDDGRWAKVSYDLEHQVVLMAYGPTDPDPVVARQRTIDLSERVARMLHERGSIPLYAEVLRAEVARNLRVLRPSISMGLEATDDEGRWTRPVEFTVRAPRHREIRPSATVGRIEI